MTSSWINESKGMCSSWKVTSKVVDGDEEVLIEESEAKEGVQLEKYTTKILVSYEENFKQCFLSYIIQLNSKSTETSMIQYIMYNYYFANNRIEESFFFIKLYQVCFTIVEK